MGGGEGGEHVLLTSAKIFASRTTGGRDRGGSACGQTKRWEEEILLTQEDTNKNNILVHINSKART